MCSSESSERMEPSLWNFKGFEYRMKAAPQHIGLSEGPAYRVSEDQTCLSVRDEVSEHRHEPGEDAVLIETLGQVGGSSIRDALGPMPVENSLYPAEVLQREPGVPYFGYVRDPIAFKLHHVDVIGSDSPTGWRNRPALSSMGPIKYAIRSDVVSGDVRRE